MEGDPGTNGLRGLRPSGAALQKFCQLTLPRHAFAFGALHSSHCARSSRFIRQAIIWIGTLHTSSMAAPCSKLAEAIARIDALVEALKSGKLLGAAASAAAPAPTSAVAAPAAASRPAAAPKPATLAAQPAAAAAPKQAKKEKTKAAKPAAAAAPAAEEDAFAKAQLVVRCGLPARLRGLVALAQLHTAGPVSIKLT